MKHANSLATIAIAETTVQGIANQLYNEASYWASISGVTFSKVDRWLRPTIYMWRVATADGRLVFDCGTYGQSGQLWQVSTDDGSTWRNASSFDDVLKLVAVYFA